MLPLTTVQSYDARLERFEDPEARADALSMLGPVTAAALDAGDSQLFCFWGIPNSGAIAYVSAAIVSEQAAAVLTSALRDSIYTETTNAFVDADAAFEYGPFQEHQWHDEIVLRGDILLVVSRTIEETFIEDAFANIQRLNAS